VEYRLDHLAGEELARQWERRGLFARYPRTSLRQRKLNPASFRFSTETGLRIVHQPRRACCKRLLHPVIPRDHTTGCDNKDGAIALRSIHLFLRDASVGIRERVVMPYIDAAGVKLHFEETGHGYPIIFVHEFGADLREWEAQVRNFCRAYRCITYNARGYPPSDVPEDSALYGWEYSVEDIAAVMQGLGVERAHVVGLSMRGYAALQFGLRYPEKVSAIVAAAAGSGSLPSQRHAWLRETSFLACAFIERGMETMAQKMAHSPTRIQLKYKDPKSWQDFTEHLRQHSAQGMANTMARYQSLRPSLYDFRSQFSRMTIPVLLAVGDEDVLCLETNLMLKSTLPAAGLWMCPNTGHAINLEEPAAFNAHVEDFLSAVERGSWRRDYPRVEQCSDVALTDVQVRAISPVHIRQAPVNVDVLRLRQQSCPL
jgi:pimeloyl-ACP methyl ester carboxylesterase